MGTKWFSPHVIAKLFVDGHLDIARQSYIDDRRRAIANSVATGPQRT